jgi:hypothetical protein
MIMTTIVEDPQPVLPPMDCYTQAVTEQQTVDRLAVQAGPRVTSLLRLRSVKHVYEESPGGLNSTVLVEGQNVRLDKLKQSSQPYRDIERFLGNDKVAQYIVGPGLLPVVTAISKEIMGKRLLVTRKMEAKNSDKGVVAHLETIGVRVLMHFDEAAGDTIVTWESLYGVI